MKPTSIQTIIYTKYQQWKKMIQLPDVNKYSKTVIQSGRTSNQVWRKYYSSQLVTDSKTNGFTRTTNLVLFKNYDAMYLQSIL